VKRQVPVDNAGALRQDDLRVLRDIVPSADLYMRASASPSALETNITARLTAGALWDVKDVDTSPDGTRVIFAMRGPLAKNQNAKDPPSWRIYEYLIKSDTLHALIDPAKFNEKIRPSTKPSLRNSARKNGYLPIGGALPSLVGGAQGQMRGVALSGREQVG